MKKETKKAIETQEDNKIPATDEILPEQYKTGGEKDRAENGRTLWTRLDIAEYSLLKEEDIRYWPNILIKFCGVLVDFLYGKTKRYRIKQKSINNNIVHESQTIIKEVLVGT